MGKRKYAGVDISNLFFDPTVAAEAAVKLASKSSVITRDDALKIGGEFAARVRERVDPAALVFVFGSTVKGEANLKSDIDIAVVSETNGGDIYAAFANLSCIAHEINWNIEVHAVAPVDWREGAPHVLEIQKWGIPV
jgi:predicted nucleotidyltransferase